VRTPVNLFLDDLRQGTRHTEPAEAAVPRGGLVEAVRPGSPAAAAGIRPGARVLAANGRLLRDVVDYQFYTAEPVVELRVREPEGEERIYRFEKWPDDDLGLAFGEATWDGVRVCTNTCPFCFLKGLPKGMRRTLYVKDDDYRLSFLHGNFVTLTNLTDADWRRLEEQRLSPLYVSVHATELELRRRLLGNPTAPDILAQLRRLGALRIRAHTQVVLCPGVNDGVHLDRTIADLGALYPTVQSIAVVPVGATMQFEQRMGLIGKALAETRRCSPDYARHVVRQVHRWQRRFRAEHGATIVHAADEYLLLAGARVPAAVHYEGFPQYENGIGMTRALIDDWHRTRRALLSRRPLPQPAATRPHPPREAYRPLPQAEEGLGVRAAPPPHLTVACGTLIAPTLTRLFGEFAAVTGLRVEVVPVPNRRFGERINVSGLLTASDFIAELAGRDLGDAVLLPRTALDYFGRKFLDDGTPADVERALGRPVRFASDLSEALTRVRELWPALALRVRARGGESAPRTNGIFWAARD
jgi:putative radical SAM enzyme (TIGR03279 family)